MKQASPFRDPLFRVIVTSGLVLLLTAAVLMHFDTMISVLGSILHAVRPLLLGVLFASMLSPSYERLCTDFTAFAVKHGQSPKAGWIRGVSLAGAILPPLLVLTSVICILIPQLMQSVQLFSDNISLYSEKLSGLLAGYEQSAMAGWIPAARLEQWLMDLQEQLPALLLKTYDYTASALGVLLDIGIGVVFSLYLLADKHRLRAQVECIGSYVFSRHQMARLLDRGRMTCGLFARFLSSQCKEAMILGILCWCGMRLFHFPYPVLISVMIGITNVVPYIGPLVGTIPSVLLLLLVKPGAVLWFLLFIVVLQQLESNLIYPRIVGSSIGLPPAWVLAAITCGGGLFGMTGMLLAVPLAAVLYAAFFPSK